MARIQTVPCAEATGETADAYAYMRQVGGLARVVKVVQLFSLRPGSMRRIIRLWELSNWIGDEARQTRELVAAAVSRLNDCHY